MRRLLLSIATCAACLGAAPAIADYDAALEAREAAQRRAAAQEEARRKAEVDRIKGNAEMKSMRGFLGKEAEGKSDAEVKRLYAAKVAAYKAAAARTSPGAGFAAEAQRTDAATRAQRDAAMQSMYGKSLKDLEGMSDKELEAFARDAERKYGGK